MHDLSIRRLIWKEYRTQRSLWLALVAGAVLLQSLVLWYPAAGSIRLQFPLVITYVLSACFAAACGGILFAGEDEEETRAFLRQLPLQPWRAVLAKLSFGIGAVLAFLCVTLVTAALVVVVGGGYLGEMLRQDLTVYGKSVAGTFFWGVLLSLLTRRVLPTVVCTLIAEVLLVGFLSNFWVHSPHESVGQYTSYAAAIAIVAAADVVLTLRWAAGQPVLGLRVRGPAMPAAERRQRMWLKAAEWTSRRGSPDTRATTALVWRELRGIAPFCLWWGLLGVLLVDLVTRLLPMVPTHIAFLAATPAVCGLMTCLGDQRRQTHRFLADHGVSAARVWWCKQIPWLLTALLLVTAFTAWDFLAGGRFDQQRAQGMASFSEAIRQSVHIPSPVRNSAYDDPASRELQWWFILSVGSMLFAAGQFAGFWFRRTVLAAGLLLVVVPVIWIWHFVAVVAGDIPLGIASWPITVALLLGTLLSSSRWLVGDASWRRRIAPVGTLLLALLIAGFASASHRANAVPQVHPGFDVEFAVQQSGQFDREWSQRWAELVGELRLANSRNQPLTAERFARLESLMLPLGQELAAPHGRIDPLLLILDDDVPIVLVQSVLASRADRLTAEGDLQGAWESYVAGLRITRYLSEQCSNWSCWTTSMLTADRILADIRGWAAHPDQTPEQLETAYSFLSDEVRSPRLARQMLMNRYAYTEQLLAREGPIWDRLDLRPTWFGLSAGDARFWLAALPWYERERLRRLIAIDTSVSLGNSSGLSEADAALISRRAASTTLPPDFQYGLWEYWRLHLEGEILHGQFSAHHTQVIATALVLALQMDRLQQEEFPPTLFELSDRLPYVQVSDPFTGSPFGYRPEGFPGRVLLQPGVMIPAGQPLLWSSGPGRSEIVQASGANESAWKSTGLEREEFFASPGGQFAPRTGLTETPAADPDRIWFVILGTGLGDTPDNFHPSEP